MTISGTMLSSFLITLGLLLGAIGLGGDVANPFRDMQIFERSKAEPLGKGGLEISAARTRTRTRFVAAETSGAAATKRRIIAAEKAATHRANAKEPPATKPAPASAPTVKPSRKVAGKERRPPPPQQAGLQWPWSFFGK